MIEMMNRIRGVMLIVLASSVVGRVFEPRSGQTKDYEIGICCFPLITQHYGERARSQNNVSTRGLFFQ